MSWFFTVDRKQQEILPRGHSNSPEARHARNFGAGEALYHAGSEASWSGVLASERISGVHATRSYCVNFGTAAA